MKSYTKMKSNEIISQLLRGDSPCLPKSILSFGGRNEENRKARIEVVRRRRKE